MHCWKPKWNACPLCGIFSSHPVDSGLFLHPWEAILSGMWKNSEIRRSIDVSFNSGKAVFNCSGLYTLGSNVYPTGCITPWEKPIPLHCFKTCSETHVDSNNEIKSCHTFQRGKTSAQLALGISGLKSFGGVILPTKPLSTLFLNSPLSSETFKQELC